jgi:hypothetical protein
LKEGMKPITSNCGNEKEQQNKLPIHHGLQRNESNRGKTRAVSKPIATNEYLIMFRKVVFEKYPAPQVGSVLFRWWKVE